MGAPCGGNAHFKESVYELHEWESHGFSPSLHIVWITKYRYKVLEGALRERIRTMIRQVCRELGVQIVSGVLSREHVHMFVEIPPHIAVGDVVRRVKGRSSHRVQMEFSDLRKRTWGRHFWARATSPPRVATLRTKSYFSIFRSTNLPASAGSYSVVFSLGSVQQSYHFFMIMG